MKKIHFLVISIFLFIQMMNAQELTPVSYKEGTQKLNGLITSNAGKNLPGVLILPAWRGIDEEAKNVALDLEKQGYTVFIADIYGEGNIPQNNTDAAKIAGFYKNNYKKYQSRIELALNQLKKEANPEKIAVIGYCFGGTGTLETARAGFPVLGIVSIHGGLAKDSNRENIPLKTKILIENPAEDKSVSQEDYNNLVKEMNEGKTDWQIITYVNCGHTFTNPQSPEYNKIMADRAWKHTLLFLQEILK